MAVTKVATITRQGTSSAPTATFAFDRSTGDFVVVRVTWRRSGTQNISSVTYGGQTMTSGVAYTPGSQGVAIYYLASAPAGSNDVVITFDVAATCNACATSYSGASGTVGTAVTWSDITTLATSTSASALSSAADELCIDVIANDTDKSATLAPGAGESSDAIIAVGDAGAQTCSAFGSEAGAASVTMGWSWTGGARAIFAAIPINSGTTLSKKLKLLAHSSAASATSIAGVVFNAPTGSDITGSRIGEFTGGAFEAALESGQAVLKVACADFGGTALTTSDTPVALVRNATYTTGAVSCTVIEE